MPCRGSGRRWDWPLGSSSRLPDLAGDELPPLIGDQCQPRHAIFFLKTHKCGSSTVQNILLRHGERHGLDFVLPEQRHYFGPPVRAVGGGGGRDRIG